MFYDEDIYEDSNSDESDIATSTDATEIDYQKLEESFYNALDKYYKDNKSDSKTVDYSKYENNQNAFDPVSVVEFASETDAKLYTVSTVGEPTSVAQQEVAYLLDVRNILLIFLFAYFIFNMYGKLKNTLISYYERS